MNSPSNSLLPIAILASGEGTNCQAILDAIAAGTLAATVRAVISNVPIAPVLARAQRANVPTYVVESPSACALLETLEVSGAALICLAGYMKLLPPGVVAAYRNQIMNIHPALLPAFPGLDAVRRALAAGVKATGVTVHFVDEGVDTGPIILQEAIPIAPDDSEATLAEKLHVVEHRLYPQAIRLFAEGRLRLVGRKVLIRSDKV